MRTRTRASPPLLLDAVILRCASVGADCSSLPPFVLPGRPGSSRCDGAWEWAGGSAAAVPRLLSGRIPCGTAIPSERETETSTRDSELALPAPSSRSSCRSLSRRGTAELRRLVQSGATGGAQLSAIPKKAPCLLRPSELTAVSEVRGSREEERWELRNEKAKKEERTLATTFQRDDIVSIVNSYLDKLFSKAEQGRSPRPALQLRRTDVLTSPVPPPASTMGRSGSLLGSEHLQLVLLGSLAAATTFFLVTFLIFLCSSCNREKKPRQYSGDHENLMNVPSDKEVTSHSVTSLATDVPASSEQNGALTNGDIVSEDSSVTCMQHYEEVQTSASDLLDSQDSTGKPKCHQSRELPRIPPDSAVGTMVSASSMDGDPGVGTEGPYEVLKDSSSQENMVEDCLYETVKEIKEMAGAAPPGKGPSGQVKATSSLKELPAEGRADFAEYASVDRNKKCRQSVNADSVLEASQDPEEEAPPPVPIKLLDENENLREKDSREAGEESAPEGTSDSNKRFSSLSYKSREEDPTLTEEEISAMYSSVHKPGQPGSKSGQSLKAPESSSGAVQRPLSSCNDLYATVTDFEKAPNSISMFPQAGRPREEPEPDYEAIQTLSREDEKAAPETGGHRGPCPKENDYESIGDLQQQCRDVTRL